MDDKLHNYEYIKSFNNTELNWFNEKDRENDTDLKVDSKILFLNNGF